MKVGIRFANADWRTDPESAVDFARHAEACGYDSLWAVDRPSVPWTASSRYPYDEGKLPEFFHDIDIADPLTWLTWVAAHTEHIGLATGVLILPLRPLIPTAKQLATMAVLSGGRLVLGVGAGWLREEFDASGVDFHRRHAALDEAIAALRVLWTQPHATFSGDTVSFTDLDVRPRPARPVQIVIGGSGVAAARRAGRLGDGFHPARTTPVELPTLLRAMRRAAEVAGRDPDGIEVTVGSPPDLETLLAFRAAGADRALVAPPGRNPVTCAEALTRMRTCVLPALE